MIEQIQSTTLNPVQLHLLQMFEHTKTKKELEELKKILAEYYAAKADEAMDIVWEEKKLNQSKIDEIAKQHIRTPYK